CVCRWQTYGHGKYALAPWIYDSIETQVGKQRAAVRQDQPFNTKGLDFRPVAGIFIRELREVFEDAAVLRRQFELSERHRFAHAGRVNDARVIEVLRVEGRAAGRAERLTRFDIRVVSYGCKHIQFSDAAGGGGGRARPRPAR